MYDLVRIDHFYVLCWFACCAEVRRGKLLVHLGSSAIGSLSHAELRFDELVSCVCMRSPANRTHLHAKPLFDDMQISRLHGVFCKSITFTSRTQIRLAERYTIVVISSVSLSLQKRFQNLITSCQKVLFSRWWRLMYVQASCNSISPHLLIRHLWRHGDGTCLYTGYFGIQPHLYAASKRRPCLIARGCCTPKGCRA